ncbi:MAG TPA: DUF2231 domain-containing protein [Verrucomicrobiae bacterium]|nr:DUF2231 domain-containing protein [Verrucomicrobiae bacterium]
MTETFLYHPPLVHFPIAFSFLEFLLLVLGRVKKNDEYFRFAFLTFVLCLLSLPFVVGAGFVDLGGFAGLRNDRVQRHVFSALTFAVINLIRIPRWRQARQNPGASWASLAAGAAASALLAGLTGYFGGFLID